MIQEITVHDRYTGDVVHIGPVYTVADFFGIYKKSGGKTIYIINGDDDFWQVSFSFDESWLWKIYSTIFQFYMDWKIEQNKPKPKKGI
jgi:hypothetical protein